MPLSPEERIQLGLSANATDVQKPVANSALVTMPDTTAPAAPVADFGQQISKYTKLLGEHYNQADEKIGEDFSYYRAAIGMKSFDDVKRETSQEANDARRAAGMSQAEALVASDDLVRVIIPLVDSLPYMKHVMEASAAGSMVTGGTFAGGGFVFGGPVGAGAAGAAGLLYGGPAAAFGYSAIQGTGSKYKELREAGIPHADAAKYAMAAGTINGAIEGAQSFLLTKGATQAFGAVMKSPTGVKLMKNAVYKFLANAGMEGAEEGSQEIADIIINHMASKQFKIPSLSDPSKWMQRVTQAVATGAFVGGTVGAGLHTAGNLTAKASKLALKGKNGTFAETVRDMLDARDEAIAEEKAELKAADIKKEIPTSLKQAIAQAEAVATVKGQIVKTTTSVHVANPTKTPLEGAQDDFDKARTNYREAQANHKSVSGAINDLLQSGGVVSKTLQGQLDQTIKLEDEAKMDYEAAKLALVKAKIEEQMKGKGLTPEELATLQERADEIRAKERKIKLEVAHRSLGRQAAKLDATLRATVEEIESRKTEKENKKAGLFKKYFGTAKPLESTGSKKKDKKNQKNHFREDGAPKNTMPVVDQMIAMEAAAIDKTLPTARLEAQAETLKSRRDTLRLMQELIENDLLSNAEIAELRHAIPASRAKELVNLAISKLHSSARDIAWSTKKKVAANQKVLRDLITLSGLSQEDQARFLKQLPKVQSPVDLRNIMLDGEVTHKDGTVTKTKGFNTLIAELIETRAKEDAVDKLQGAIAKAAPRRNGSGLYSRFSRKGELQFYLDTIDEMINPTPEQVASESKKGGDGNATDRAQKANIEAALNKRNITAPDAFTTDDEIREMAAERVGVLSEQSAADVRKLTTFINEAVNNGLKEREAQLAGEAEAQQDLNTEVEMAIVPNMAAKDIDLITAPNSNFEDNSYAARIKRYTKTAGAETFSWDGMLDIAFQDLAPAQRTKLKEKLSLGRHLDREKAMFNKYVDSLHRSMAEAAGISVEKLLQHSVRSTKEMISFEWTDSQGRDQSTGFIPEVTRKGLRLTKKALTVDVAQDMLLQMRDKELSRGLIDGNGFTLKGMHYVELNEDGSVQVDEKGEPVLGVRIPDHLTAEGALEIALARSAPNDINLKVLEGARSFYAKMYADIAAEYKADTGRRLEDNPNYSGPALHTRAVDQSAVDSFRAEMKARAANQGTITGRSKATKLRTDSALALKFTGIYGKATSHAAQSAHWIAWRAPSKAISRALLNSRTKALLEFKYGKGYVNGLQSHIQDATVGRVERHDSWLKHYNSFLSRMGPLVLMGKIQQFPKQLTGMISALLEMKTVDLISGVHDFNSNIDKATDILTASPQFRNRYDGTLNSWQGALLKRDPGKIKDPVMDFLGLGLIEGDKYVSLQIAWAKYRAELKAKTTEEIAMERAWNLVERTQSSGRQDQLGNVARTPGWKWLSQFRQQPQRANEFQATAHRDFMNGHINIVDVIRVHMITRGAQVAFAAIDVAIAYALTADDKKRDALWLRLVQEFALGPTGMLSDLYAYMYVKGENQVLKAIDGKNATQVQDFEPTTSAAQAIKSAGQLFTNYFKAIDDGEIDAEEFLILWGNYAKSIGRLIDKYPTEPFIKAAKAAYGVEGESIKPPKMLE